MDASEDTSKPKYILVVLAGVLSYWLGVQNGRTSARSEFRTQCDRLQSQYSSLKGQYDQLGIQYTVAKGRCDEAMAQYSALKTRYDQFEKAESAKPR